jgi:hypothetical protein
MATELRRRMLADMQIRWLSQRTQEAYVPGASRRDQLALILEYGNHGASPAAIVSVPLIQIRGA